MTDCPYPYFALNTTRECVLECPATGDYYGHPIQRVCVVVTDCYKVGTQEYFADSTTRLCVQKCPLTLWADYNIYKCVATCPTG